MNTVARKTSPIPCPRQKPHPVILAGSVVALLALGLAPGSLRAQLVIDGPLPGNASGTEISNPSSGTAPILPFLPFTGIFNGSVTVAAGDGAIIVAEGKGGGAVQVYNSSGQFEYSFNPFGSTYTGGVSVGIADGELVVGQASGGSRVNVYNDSTLLSAPPTTTQNSFFALVSTFKGGVSVALGDGHLVVGAGPGGGGAINVFDDTTLLTGAAPTGQALFSPFPSSFSAGVNVAIGSGNLVLSTASGVSQVNVYSDAHLMFGTTPTLLNTFFPYASTYTGGVSVAAGNGLIAIGSSAVGGSQVNVYNAATLTQQSSFSPFSPTFKGGVNVALLPVPTTWTGATDGDWNKGSNWDIGTAPNGFNANAIFGASTEPLVSPSANTEVNSITFNANATSPYGITIKPNLALTISGTGITNDPTNNTTQNFVTATDSNGNVGSIIFRNGATAGTKTTFSNSPTTAVNSVSHGGYLQFSDSSSAGSATITNYGGVNPSGLGGETTFLGTSTAANSTIANQGPSSGIQGGQTVFSGASTAASATISNNASTSGALGSATTFNAGSTAASATINNNAGSSNGAPGGTTEFFNAASAGRATIYNNAGAGNAGSTQFFQNSTAGGTITNAAATSNSTASGSTTFSDDSSAGGALIFNSGATVNGASGGSTMFSGNSSAGSAQINNNAGTSGGLDGTTFFTGHADGGTAAIVNNGSTGVFDISGLTDGGMKIGVIDGGGTFNLGTNTLTIVGNGDTAFTVTGVIEGAGGSLVLSTAAAFNLTGANTYTGTTGINNGGTLNANTTNTLNGTPVVMDQTGSTGFSTLNLGADQTIASLTGAASSTVNLNGNTLSVGNNNFPNTTFAGVIADGTGSPGSGGLTVNSTTTLTLSGLNTYTGATNLMSNSFLQIGNGTSGNLDSATVVTVAGGASLAIDLANGALFSADVILNGSNASFRPSANTTNMISGVISGNGTLFQAGAGPVILLSANPNFTGSVSVSDVPVNGHFVPGVLQIGTPGTAASIGSSTVQLAGGTLTLVNVAGGFFTNNVSSAGGATVGTVNINSANTITLQGALTDGAAPLALTKNGPGTALLSGVNNSTYTGATTINGGVLEVDVALGDTLVTVNNQAALSGNGTIGGFVTINKGGVLAPGISEVPGTLFITGDLTEKTGGISVFRIGAPGNSDEINVSGNLSLLGGTLSVIPLAGFGPGTYTLLTWGGPNVDLSGLSANLVPGYTDAFNINTTTKQLQISFTLATGTLPEQDWNATAGGSPTGGSGTWNTTSSVWSNPSNPSSTTTWKGGTADFGVASGTVTIPAATTISAQGLIFDIDGYTIAGADAKSALKLTGSGPIITLNNMGVTTINVPVTSTTGLTVNGGGTLVLANTANAITGKVSVITGNLQLGTSGMAATDGSLGPSSTVILSNGASLSIVNVLNNTLPNAISAGLAQNGTVFFNSTNPLTVSGALTDGFPGQLSLSQFGSGTTTLTNSKNTNSGLTTIFGGTLQIGTSTTAGSLGPSSLVSFMGGGTLNLCNVSGGVFPNSVTMNAAGPFASVVATSKTNLTLSGSFTESMGALGFYQQGTGTVILSGNNSYSYTEVDSGTLQVGDGTTAWTSISAFFNQIQVNGPAKGTSILAIDLANGAIFSNAISLNATNTSLNAIQTGTNTLTGVISSPMSNGGGFNQTGTGTTILAAAETYTGATTISAGTLQIGNGLVGSLASSGVTVSAKGTLALDLPTGSTFSQNVNLGTTNTTDVQAIQPGFMIITGIISGSGGFVQNGPGTTVFSSATPQTYKGPTNINEGALDVETLIQSSPVNVQGGTLTSFSGGIETNVTLSKNGTIDIISPSDIAGTLTVTGTGGNWTGFAAVGGVVTVSSGNFNLGPGDATLTAPKGVIVSGAGTISVSDNTGTIAGNLTYSSTASSTFGGIVADQSATAKSSLTMNKAGILNLTGPNTYSGPTTVTAGYLQIGNGFTGSIASASIVTVASGATLALDLYDSADFLNSVTLNGGTLFTPQPGTLTLPVPIGGTNGTFIQDGTGTTILSATETFTGTTAVQSGILQIGDLTNGNIAGSTPVGNTVTVDGGTLTGLGDINGNANLTGGTINFAQSGNFAGAILGTLTVNGGTWAGQGQVLKAVTVSSGTFVISGNLTAPSGVTVTGTSASTGGTIIGSGTLTGSLNYTSKVPGGFPGVIADGASKSSVTMNSANTTLVLNGANTYTGPTTVMAGKLQIGDATHGSISSMSRVIVSSGAELDLNFPVNTTFSNAVTLNGGTLETFGADIDLDIQTVISGTGGFTQSALGPVILEFAQQYTGPTQVTFGTLILTGPTAANAMPVTVGPLGTLEAPGNVQGSVTSSGILAGTVNIGGTLTLTGGTWTATAGTVSKAVTVTSGIFSIGSGATLTAPMGFNVNGGAIFAGDSTATLIGSLTYKSPSPSTFAGVIADVSGTAKSGLTMSAPKSTLTLTGTNTYTGATTITAGTLVVNGSLAKSLVATTVTGGTLLVNGSLGDTPVVVNSGGILGGSGTINGVETINSGGILAPSDGGTPTTFTVGNLTLTSGAKVDYQLGAAGATMSGVNDFTMVNGTLALGSATLNITKDFGFGAGTYELFSATSAPTGTLKIGTIPTGFTASNFSIQIVGDQVNLLVNTSTANNAQYWNGTGGAGINGGSGTWDNSTPNWGNSSGTANAAWAGAAGVFSAGSGTVTVGANVTATSFGFVPGAGAYTINVNPTFTLTISGTGVTNTSGTTQNLATGVNGSGQAGSISFTNSASAGNVAITNNGATVAATTGGVTTFQGTSTAASATITNGGGSANGASGGITNFIGSSAGSPTAGSAIITNNAGTSSGKDGAVFFVGTASGGTAQIINNGGGDFDMSGMTTGLSIGSISGAGVFNLGSKALTVGGNGLSTTVTGVLQDGGKFNGTAASLVKVGTGTLTLTGANTYTGATTVNGGTLQIGDGSTSATALASSSVVTVNGSSATLAIDLKNGHSFGNQVKLSSGGHVQALETSSFVSSTISSAISGAGDLTVNATNSTVILTGNNSYSSGTTVSAGTLVVNNTTSGTGTNTVTVDSGATLGGSGKITGAIALEQGGVLEPAATSINVAGAPGTTLTAGSLQWNRGSKLVLQLDSAGHDELSLTGALTKETSGTGLYTLDIHDDGGIPLGDYTLATFASTTFAATDFTLELPASYTGTLSITGGKDLVLDLTGGSGQLPSQSENTDSLASASIPTPSLDSGLDSGTASSLSVTPTPEPGSAMLVGLGGLWLLGWRRRRRG